jgi:hypothetical protein
MREARRLSIQFLTPKGNPVYLRRPDLVVAICGYHTTYEGRPALATRIQFEQGDQLFVRGDVDAIQAALDEWQADQLRRLVISPSSECPCGIGTEECPGKDGKPLCARPVEQFDPLVDARD